MAINDQRSQAAANPYPGPRSFQRGEQLYGRERETWQLVDLLIAERIVLLYSPSGAGKTSLIQAALVPELEREGFRVYPPLRVSLAAPEPDAAVSPNRYVGSLLLSLEQGLPDSQRAGLADLSSLSLEDYLDRFAATATASGEVFIFDQFEEILTLTPADRAGKAAFFEQVGQVLRNRNRWALFAMREEFIAGLDPFLRALPTRFANTYRLPLLGPEAARQAMQEPAQGAGIHFTDQAASKLADDLRVVRIQQADGSTETALGDTIEPVQLQVVCRRLWDGLQSGDTTIGVDDLQEVGDVDTALRSYYADTTASIAQQIDLPERSIRQWVDAQLITEQGIRGQVLQDRDQSQGLDNRAIWALVNAHLVRAEQRRGATWFELAHDRLIEPVRADNIAWRETHLSTLQRQASLWQQEGRPGGLLLQEEALATAEIWAAAHDDQVLPHEAAFLEACWEAEAVRQRERRQTQRIRWLAVVLAVIAGLALVASLAAWRTARQARSRELAAASVARLTIDPEESILLALQALNTSTTAEAEEALHRAVQESRLTRLLSGHSAEVNDVAYSPDGSRLATSSVDRTVKVWQLEPDSTEGGPSSPEPITLTGHSDTVYGLSFSPCAPPPEASAGGCEGSRLAAAGQDGTVRVWDVDSGQEVLTLAGPDGHTSRVYDVVHSPDGSLLATGSTDGTAKLWDAKTGVLLQTLSSPQGESVFAVAFSSDGSRLAVVGGQEAPGLSSGMVVIWDLSAGVPQLILDGHRDTVSSVAFSHDGSRLVTGSWDETARVWDAVNGQSLLTLGGHSNWVRDVAFSPDDNQIATTSWDRTAKVWDARTGQELISLAGHRGWLRGLAFNPDGQQLATAGEDKVARVWNIGPSREVLTIPAHEDAVRSVSFSPDGTQLLSGGDDGSARMWMLTLSFGSDTATAELLLTLSHYGPVRGVAISGDGQRLATGSEDRTAVVWDANTGQALSTIDLVDAVVTAVDLDETGKQLVTGGSDFQVDVWDVTTSDLLRQMEGHGSRVNSVMFGDSAQQVLSAAADGSARLWDTASGTLQLALTGHNGEVYDAVYDREGRRVATAGVDQTARIWDARSGDQRLVLNGHIDRVQGVAFSPDGSQLATASWDGTVKLWDASSGQLLLTLSGTEGRVLDVAFSPNGSVLATAGQDGTVRLYQLDLDWLQELAWQRVVRPLTAEECQRLFGDPCRER
jgi:WD40 repeat protein